MKIPCKLSCIFVSAARHEVMLARLCAFISEEIVERGRHLRHNNSKGKKRRETASKTSHVRVPFSGRARHNSSFTTGSKWLLWGSLKLTSISSASARHQPLISIRRCLGKGEQKRKIRSLTKDLLCASNFEIRTFFFLLRFALLLSPSTFPLPSSLPFAPSPSPFHNSR